MVYDMANDTKFKNFLPFKYAVMYSLGISTGLRVSDLCKLKKEQVLNNNRPTITAQKTGKKKRIFISEKNSELIKQLVSSDTSGSEYLFPSPSNPRLPISRQAVHKAFSIASAKAGVTHSVGTHCMRKKYAKRTFKRTGNDIIALKQAMQHNNLSDSALYLLSPKENKKNDSK